MRLCASKNIVLASEHHILRVALQNQIDLLLRLIAHFYKRILNATILNIEWIVFYAKCTFLWPINNVLPEKL